MSLGGLEVGGSVVAVVAGSTQLDHRNGLDLTRGDSGAQNASVPTVTEWPNVQRVTEYDLEFHFTSGATLYATVRDGRDAIQDTDDVTKVTVTLDDGSLSTLTVHRDKLNAVQSTQRTFTIEPPVPEVV